jgi:hypothetical protein
MRGRGLGHLVGVFAVLAPPATAAHAQARGGPVTEKVWVDPASGLAPDARGAPRISNILFVNRCPGNCLLTPGVNDARLDTSTVIDETTQVSEFEHSDEVFDQVIECLRDVYAPYDVDIVTEDPGDDVFHHEAILAGRPQEIGRPQNVGGIAPYSCEPLNNVISFSFANQLGPDVEDLCWTVAQESAHAFGLPSHVYDCLDPMTYLEGPCGRKYFRNRAIECGEFEPGTCQCGGSAQNSHRELLRTFGPGTEPPPPEVALLYPEADATVDDNFSIFFTAVDPRLVDHVDVYLNGVRVTTMDGHDYPRRAETYDLRAPDHPDGYIDVEIRAYNEISGEAGVARTRVLKGEPCQSTDDCFDFMECSEGSCAYPAPAGELGDECEYDQYCLSGPCAEVGGDRRCTQSCTLGVADACPEGYECLEPGYCWGGGGDGGCGAAGGRDGQLPLAMLGVAAAALLARRRRATARA